MDESTAPTPPEPTKQPTLPKIDKTKLKASATAARLKAIGIAATLLLCISAGFLGGWLGASSRDHQGQLDTRDQQRLVSGESKLISNIVKDMGESVVSVNVTSLGARTDFYGFTRSVEEESAGTGIILNKEGVVITNRHVIPEGTQSVSLVLSDGTVLDNVEVIGRTNENDTLDIAFLKITDKKGKDLKAAKLGDSSKMVVGDKVVAIGNALGRFENTVTTGIISGYGRSVIAADETTSEELQNLFQTDAAINQGNSGGPLVNMNGEVIGINTAIAGGAENIGFSIPINDAKGLIRSVLEKGKLERPYLGVRYVSLTDDYAEELGVDVDRGAYIITGSSGQPPVLPGSPAEKAGLREGDVILKINNDDVNEKNSLTSLISRHEVGDEVTLKIHRGGQGIDIKATLEAQE